MSVLVTLAVTMSSCSDTDSLVVDHTVSDPDAVLKQTVLVYAVAANNLERYLGYDKKEMLEGMADVDLKKYSLLVYEVTSERRPRLIEVVDSGEGRVFQEIKSYGDDCFSTDPVRIAEVIEDMRVLRPSERYGIVFWSHGSGWSPTFSTHEKENDRVAAYAYGQDTDGYVTDSCDIIELADAIPSGVFDFIWFDCCYMAGIETAYQLRDKARWFVGYPTEIWSEGMPYDDTLPYIMREKYDLVAAAKLCFNWYDSRRRSATATVADLTLIEEVASAARPIFRNYTKPSDTKSFQTYHTRSDGPFYDFMQLAQAEASMSGSATEYAILKANWREFVIYSNVTDNDFRNKPFDKANCCGMSTHMFSSSGSMKESYYRQLDWYKRVYSEE